MKTWIFLVFTFCGSLAFAEGEDIISGMNDCLAEASTRSAQVQCAREGYIDADSLLNRRWQAIISIMRSREIASLKANQNNWIYRIRNTTCQANPDTGLTPAGYPVGVDGWSCMARLTVKRINWLNEERGY